VTVSDGRCLHCYLGASPPSPPTTRAPVERGRPVARLLPAMPPTGVPLLGGLIAQGRAVQPPVRGRSRLRRHGMPPRRVPRSGRLLPTWTTTDLSDYRPGRLPTWTTTSAEPCGPSINWRPALPARRAKNVETPHPVEIPHAYSVFYFHAMQSFRITQSFQDLLVPGTFLGRQGRPGMG